MDGDTVLSTADIILKVRPPFDEVSKMKEGATIISFIQPA